MNFPLPPCTIAEMKSVEQIEERRDSLLVRYDSLAIMGGLAVLAKLAVTVGFVGFGDYLPAAGSAAALVSSIVLTKRGTDNIRNTRFDLADEIRETRQLALRGAF